MPRYDLYRRMRVLVTRDPSGRWRVEQVGSDGKRRLPGRFPAALLARERLGHLAYETGKSA